MGELPHYGEMMVAANLIRIIQETQPDEIYNLAAQSHVQVSFETAEYTANSDAVGTLRLLETIRYFTRPSSPLTCLHITFCFLQNRHGNQK